MARRFHPHAGNDCPVPADTIVEYLLSDDGLNVQRARAGDVYWGPGLGPDGEGRVTHYCVHVGEFERAVGQFLRGVHAANSTSGDALPRAVAAYNARFPDATITVERARVLVALVQAK